jgi:hypothetical protein
MEECITCKEVKETRLFPVNVPDLKPNNYCKECFEALLMRLTNRLNKIKKR